MSPSSLSIETTFLLDYITGPSAKVRDILNYGSLGISNSQVAGNVLAKRGATIIHTNPSFATPDINRGVTDNVIFPMQVDEQGKIINGAYVFTYTIRVTDEVLYKPTVGGGYVGVTAPGATPFVAITPTSLPPNWIADVLAIIATYSSKNVAFYNSSNVELARSPLLSVDETTGELTFNSVALASFATIAKIRIIGTNDYSKEFSYSFCNKSPQACMDSDPDCLRSQLTVSDKTPYPMNLNPSLTRVFTLQYPRYSNGTPVDTPVTTSDPTITIGPDIFSGNYTAAFETLMVYTQDDGLVVQDTITGYKEIPMNCKNTLCGLAPCINSLFDKQRKAEHEGSMNASALRLQVENVNAYLSQYNINLACRDTKKANKVMEQLSEYLEQECGCDCGCSDSSTTGEPQIIYATVTSSLTSNLITWN